MFDVLRYRTAKGSEPISDWLRSMTDKRSQARIRLRIQRLAAGNFGDSKAVGEGVWSDWKRRQP